MRIILKIIAAPFVLALMLVVAVLSFLSCIAGAVCWLACTVFVLLAACAFFAGLHTGCIAALVLAFLVSPFGAPGHRVLAAGSSVRGKIRLAGFYGKLMTSGHFVQKCRAAGKNPAARFSVMGRR